MRELLGLLKRYHASQETCCGVLVPLGFLVTDGRYRTVPPPRHIFLFPTPLHSSHSLVQCDLLAADITATFVDANGIALTMAAMKRFVHDTELVWHAIGVLNGLNAKSTYGLNRHVQRRERTDVCSL